MPGRTQHKMVHQFDADHARRVGHPQGEQPILGARCGIAAYAELRISGDPTPSAEDWHFTKRMHEAAQVIGVELLDHLVLGATGRWASLRSRGAY